jgi:hypothetical protein
VEEVLLHYVVVMEQATYVIEWVCTVRTKCVQLRVEYRIVIFDKFKWINGKNYILMIFIANLF